ncbi:uncharacterized protein LOC132904197 [Amyelois transitella]|uniref:uncharacterized protein LOC132904197 n=1 Tax=Amyelois transitella TaxID=680683 RepID=UPI00298FCF48|nr:uncharacterized protein LOC132904197 [Amyelois transitella]
MALKVLQANINHCTSAQDLLCQSMAQWWIDVAVVSEPYFVPPRDNWVRDEDSAVAIVSSASSSPLTCVVRGHEAVSARLGDLVVVGVYFSPNRPLNEFESFLTQVEALVLRCHPLPVLAAGDLNAKSTAWGSPATDARGALIEKWLITNGLAVVNRGTVPTCMRWNGSSRPDVTFASPVLARRVEGWSVLEDVETLSDHRYIRFDLSTSSVAPSGPSRTPNEASPRWQLKRLDKEFLREAAIVKGWSRAPVNVVVEDETEWFRGALAEICEASMPRASTRPPRRWVYWWSPELSRLREACFRARSQYARYRRRRRRDESEEAALYAKLVEAKRSLRTAIASAKETAREEQLGTLDHDPWGHPYRLVRNKLRPYAAPLTRTLDPQFLGEVVAALFPQGAAFQPPSMAPPLAERSEGVEAIPEVTRDEFAAAVTRLRAKSSPRVLMKFRVVSSFSLWTFWENG